MKACAEYIENKKKEFYSTEFAKHNLKSTFSALRSLITEDVPPLPEVNSGEVQADVFIDFFQSKIDKIVTEIESSKILQSKPSIALCGHRTVTQPLNVFEPVTTDELRRIIMSSPPKSCVLDVMPTWLLKCSLDAQIMFLLSLVNNSLEKGVVICSTKEAIVTPLLKKISLDSQVFSNYRPVSNLAFLGKTIERLVLSRLLDHLSVNNFHDDYQSAYKSRHSTETALIKIHHDIASYFRSKQRCFVSTFRFVCGL